MASTTFDRPIERLITVKRLSELNGVEYAAYNWFEVTSYSDPEPVYARGLLRSPSDAAKAKSEFEVFLDISRARIAIERESDRRDNEQGN